MKEFEISDDVPQEVVNKIFGVLEHRLNKEENPTHVSLMRHSRVVTVNNDDELYGTLRSCVESALRDWVEAQNSEDNDTDSLVFEPENVISEHYI